MSKTTMLRRMLSLRARERARERWCGLREEQVGGGGAGRESAGEAATRPSLPPSHSPRPSEPRHSGYFSPTLLLQAGRPGPGWEELTE